MPSCGIIVRIIRRDTANFSNKSYRDWLVPPFRHGASYFLFPCHRHHHRSQFQYRPLANDILLNALTIWRIPSRIRFPPRKRTSQSIGFCSGKSGKAKVSVVESLLKQRGVAPDSPPERVRQRREGRRGKYEERAITSPEDINKGENCKESNDESSAKRVERPRVGGRERERERAGRVNETLKAFVGTNANPHGCANV